MMTSEDIILADTIRGKLTELNQLILEARETGLRLDLELNEYAGTFRTGPIVQIEIGIFKEVKR